MKKRLLMILILSFIFIAGCTSLFGGTQTSTVKGVGARFLPGSPGTQLSEGLPFTVGLEVSNNGMTGVDGEICVSDDKFATFGGIEAARDCQAFSLAGNLEQQGEFTSRSQKINFPNGGDYVYRDISSDLNTKITATLSYNYQTIINPQICLSNNERDCPLSKTISGSALGKYASSSPVTVTKIEQTTSKGGSRIGVNLNIFIENVGGGKAVSSTSTGDDKERIDVDINLVGSGIDFKCKPESNVVVLDNGKATVSCTADLQLEEGTVQTPLEITLRYGYVSSITTGDIKIRDTG